MKIRAKKYSAQIEREGEIQGDKGYERESKLM